MTYHFLSVSDRFGRHEITLKFLVRWQRSKISEAGSTSRSFLPGIGQADNSAALSSASALYPSAAA